MTRPLVVEPRMRRIVGNALDRARAQHATAERADQTRSVFERYALDPFAPLDDGVIWVHSRDFGGRVPLDPFEHQREALTEWIDIPRLQAERKLRFRNVHGEKSRQMGWSWIFSYGMWWAVVFHEAQGLALSLDADEVDDGGSRSTLKTIFGKVRYIDSNAPAWIREASPLDFSRLSIRSRIRPDSSFIIGEAAGPNPGRGGTFLFALLDEFARVSWADQVLAAVRRACPSGIAMGSTPQGTANAYYRAAHPRTRAWRYVRMHWTQHPLYGKDQHLAGAEPETCERCRLTLEGVSIDAQGEEVYTPVDGAHRYYGKVTSPWYDDAVEGVPDEEVAAEIDIDYTGSLPARVYSEWDEHRHVVAGAVPWEETLGLPELAIDYGLDCTSVLVMQDSPSELRVIGELEVANQTPDQVAAGIRGVLAELGMDPTFLSPGWTRQLFAVGDPAGENRELGTGRSLVSDYALQGFSIRSTRRRTSATINAVKRLMRGVPKRLVVAGDQCPRFVQHAGANRWPVDLAGKRRPGARDPLDDEHNHAMRAFAYYVAEKWPPPEDTSGDPGPTGAWDDDAPSGSSVDLSYGMAL